MSEKLRLGIIGMGAIGMVHAEAHQAVGEAEVSAICDTDAARLEQAGRTFGAAQRFGDYRELLKADVDAVLICTPNSLHTETALAAVEAGKDVFLEKPMALNAGQAGRIAAAADEAGAVLQIGMVWRFDPAAQLIRQWVAEGRFGEIYHMRAVMVRRRGIPGLGGWFTTKALSGGGPLIDLGVHWFDLSMHLSGQWRPTAVSAGTYAKFGPRMKDYAYVSMWAGPPRLDGVFDVEDYSSGFVRFAREATLSFEIAWAANSPPEGYVELIGDAGGVRAFDGGPLRILTEHAGRVADIEPQLDTTVNRYEAQARSFVEACRREHPPAATAQEGLTVMKLIDAVYASHQAGAEVRIEE